KVNTLHIVGGGAQSDVWCQIFADVLGVEIKQVQDPIYANARGAAWIAAVGLGEIKFEDVTKLVQFKRIYQPQLQNRALYDDKFEIFKQIYKQMRGIYRRLNH
ncbi:MAG: xylulose kinase, partial [Chloroflexi bacterium]